ncbi:hypothetical protein L917_02643, partial [Phytophthora nicotianae]
LTACLWKEVVEAAQRRRHRARRRKPSLPERQRMRSKLKHQEIPILSRILHRRRRSRLKAHRRESRNLRQQKRQQLPPRLPRRPRPLMLLRLLKLLQRKIRNATHLPAVFARNSQRR